MPRPRKQLVCLSVTPYYHVFSRCVRRAFLCGVDPLSGRSYEHRRGWIEDRIRVLSSLFSVHIAAYAVMSNHYHLVVKLCPQETRNRSDDEVLRRWTALYKGPLLVQRHLAGNPLSAAERETLSHLVRVYRRRLGDLSWFMKCLNEPIARQANAEDHCTGHFWEARFESQPLKTERALLTAMAYVDLNPVRAGLAPTPEHSHYTSLRQRIRGDAPERVRQAVARLRQRQEIHHFDCPARPLMPFALQSVPWDEGPPSEDALPMREADYLALVDTTGRIAVAGKRGRIDPALLPILKRLGLSSAQWCEATTGFRAWYRNGDLRLTQPA